PSALALLRATDAALDEMLALAADRGVSGAIGRTGSLWIASLDEADDLHAAVARLREVGVECREAAELVPAPMRGRYPHAAFFPRDCPIDAARVVLDSPRA